MMSTTMMFMMMMFIRVAVVVAVVGMVTTVSSVETTYDNDNDNNHDNDDSSNWMTYEEYLNKYSDKKEQYANRNKYTHDDADDDGNDYFYRKSIFESNQKRILQHNMKQKEQQEQEGKSVSSSSSSSFYYKMGINYFTDMLGDEIPYGYDKSMKSKVKQEFPETATTTTATTKASKETKSISLKDLPKSIDWRTTKRTTPPTPNGGGSIKVTTPIKNQGMCGSCWSFASTAALESHLAIETGVLFSLSMQELVSCSTNVYQCGGTGGCNGSTAEIAYEYIKNHGIVTEWQYGYQSFDGKSVNNCTLVQSPSEETDHDHNFDSTFLDNNIDVHSTKRKNLRLSSQLEQQQQQNEEKEEEMTKMTTATTKLSSTTTMIKGAVASIKGYENLPSNQYESLMIAVATKGPVVVNVAAHGWSTYQSGIYEDDDDENNNVKNLNINHVVVVEGYGTDDVSGLDYWLVRNSWGPEWGEDGYIRLKRENPTSQEDDDDEEEIDTNDDSSTTSSITNPYPSNPKFCKLDITPGDGVACQKDKNGNTIKPKPVYVCGTSGILYDPLIPIGGYLL